MLVLKREGDIWREWPIGLPGTYETELLPGLVVSPRQLLAQTAHQDDE